MMDGTLLSFFEGLSRKLDRYCKYWRRNHEFLLNNCPCHYIPLVRAELQRLGFPMIFSTPAGILPGTSIERLLATKEQRVNENFPALKSSPLEADYASQD